MRRPAWRARSGRGLGTALLALAIVSSPASAARPAPTGTLDLRDGADAVFSSSTPGDESGRAVVALGDVNGDGIADVAVGSPGASPLGRTRAGIVRVVFGRGAPGTVDLATLGAGGFAIRGAPGDHAGTALGSLADISGDGGPEVIVGAPTAAPAGRDGAG